MYESEIDYKMKYEDLKERIRIVNGVENISLHDLSFYPIEQVEDHAKHMLAHEIAEFLLKEDFIQFNKYEYPNGDIKIAAKLNVLKIE